VLLLDASVWVAAGAPEDPYRYLSGAIVTRCGDRLARVGADLVDSSVRIAAEHGLSAHDAAYVATARRNGWTLVSADIRNLVSKGLAVAPDAADYP
jgi:predicted nucleic acid-binding protein